MIVLKGIIREDGVVDNLIVYQGVVKEMDETALAALSKWKFTPAKRGGKAVAVQILVGIQLSGPIAH
jgi:TonB family protein